MAKVVFTPTQRYKTDKNGSYVLDKNGCKQLVDAYKGTTFEEMVVFLKENGTAEQKEAFKKACHQQAVYEKVIGKRGGESKKPTGEYIECKEINVLNAKKWFFTEFAPELLPKAKEKEKKKTMEDLLGEL